MGGVEELLGELVSMGETADQIKFLQQQQGLSDKDAITCIMLKVHENAELSGKNLAKEYMKYIVSYAELLAKFTKNRVAELQLMKVMLEFIMEDPALELGFMPTCQAL